jgi:transcriptional regulator with PAS, ATPase and Fis domain
MSMQVRLLRVLQDGEIRPLGASDVRKVDVRVIAATNRDLRRMVSEGRFREDLYYRLRVVEISIPPLRERRDDIPVLAHHFLENATRRMGRRIKGFTNAAMDRLVACEWSGNVRELENEIERVVALAGDADTITVDMLSEHVRGRPAADEAASGAVELPVFDWDLNRSVDELKRRMIQRALEETGSKSKASERLGIPRQSLQKMMKRGSSCRRGSDSRCRRGAAAGPCRRPRAAPAGSGASRARGTRRFRPRGPRPRR